jgi:hypothetical protein
MRKEGSKMQRRKVGRLTRNTTAVMEEIWRLRHEGLGLAGTDVSEESEGGLQPHCNVKYPGIERSQGSNSSY